MTTAEPQRFLRTLHRESLESVPRCEGEKWIRTRILKARLWLGQPEMESVN
jgi:hypothetical protein